MRVQYNTTAPSVSAGEFSAPQADDAGNIKVAIVNNEDIVVSTAATMTRPADTTAYASGDLVANNTTAASVTPLSFAAVIRAAGKTAKVKRVRILKSAVGVTNASFRLHLYGSDPSASTGITNGDNGAWLTKSTANYLGAIDVTVDKAFSDGAAGHGAPAAGTDLSIVLASGTTVYGLLEARGAYTPGSAETFSVSLELSRN